MCRIGNALYFLNLIFLSREITLSNYYFRVHNVFHIYQGFINQESWGLQPYEFLLKQY